MHLTTGGENIFPVDLNVGKILIIPKSVQESSLLPFTQHSSLLLLALGVFVVVTPLAWELIEGFKELPNRYGFKHNVLTELIQNNVFPHVSACLH